jgi:hypothetical protein
MEILSKSVLEKPARTALLISCAGTGNPGEAEFFNEFCQWVSCLKFSEIYGCIHGSVSLSVFE